MTKMVGKMVDWKKYISISVMSAESFLIAVVSVDVMNAPAAKKSRINRGLMCRK